MSIATKHIQKIIENSIAIEMEEAKKAGALGFMARALVQATLPHRNVPGNEFSRKNGNYTLSILTPAKIGLPYGSIPRLLLAWITTEAVKTKQRELILGRSLSDFMGQLGLMPTGGRWGSITRLREQMKRLFSASISCTYDDGHNWSIKNVTPVSLANLWWDPKQPQQSTLFESNLVLGEDFFREIVSQPVPIDIRALKGLKKSPMALDIYCWLTYRMSYLRNQTEIRWEVLQTQFGSNYAQNAQGVRDFKRAFLREARKVSVVYPLANIDQNEEGLILRKSKPHITRQVDNPVI
jgi:hypothetical protein